MMINHILYDYIKKQRKRGFSILKIKDHLTNYNFHTQDIDECIDAIRKDEMRFKINALVFLLVILSIAVFAYVVLTPSPDPELIEETAVKEDLIKKVEQKERKNDVIYADKLNVGFFQEEKFVTKDTFGKGEDVVFGYELEDINSVQIGDRYKVAFFANILVLGPDGLIDKDTSGSDNFIYDLEFDSRGRKDAEGRFTLSFDKTGEYRVIANIVDIYSSEETAAQGKVTIE